MKIQVECRIPAPKSICFKAFTDLNALADKVTAITKIEILTSGKIGVGTKFKESRVMFGKESSEVMEITTFENDSHFREEAYSGGVRYISDWNFSELNGETLVTITFKIKYETFLSKMMSPIFFFLSGSFRKAFDTDLEEMKISICGY